MTHVLRSDGLTAQVCPAEGGRVSSLCCAVSGTEFLTQARPERKPVTPGFEAQFSDGACAGIEDCLPTVGACGAATEGGRAPDHGDFWQVPWTVLERTDAAMAMHARGFSRPLSLSKHLRVKGRSLRVTYEVTNHGAESTSLLYAAHPLLAISGGDRVVLPEEVRALTMTYARGQLLPTKDGKVDWPHAKGTDAIMDLSVTADRNHGTAMMFYSGRLRHGACGLYRMREQQGIVVRFSPEQLPFLGLWLCYGGWPDAGAGPAQYAVALEPTLAPCNRLDEAQQAGLALGLSPGSTASWQIAFEVTRPGQSFAEFSRMIHSDDPL